MNKPLLMLDTDDIKEYAKDNNIKLTEEQVIEIYNSIDRFDWDCEYDTFWDFIDGAIERYLDDND